MAETQNQAPEQNVEGENTPSAETQAPKKSRRKKADEPRKGEVLTMNGVKLYVKG